MQDEIEKNYQQWFKKAEEDRLSAEVILKEGGSPGTVCFLSQQIAEKYLKGLLTYHKNKLRKVHDLRDLENLLIDVYPGIKHFEEDIILLNQYYAQTRYPGHYQDFTWEDARFALDAAKRIKDFVLTKIKG